MELVGTNVSDTKLFNNAIVNVKGIIKQLENIKTISKSKPRIIESECITKSSQTKNNHINAVDDSDKTDSEITINNQIYVKDINTYEHINPAKSEQNPSKKSKIQRNKAVDLAFEIKLNKNKKPVLKNNANEYEDCNQKPIQEVQQLKNNNNNNNENNNKIATKENPYGKHYVLNEDLKKSKYEIEFEEFEIYDPTNKCT